MIIIYCKNPEIGATYAEVLAPFKPALFSDKEAFSNALPVNELAIIDEDEAVLNDALPFTKEKTILFIGEKEPAADVSFLQKPLSSSVLYARVDLLWRRIEKGLLAAFTTSNYVFCGATRTLNNVMLTQKEAELIDYLWENKNRIVGKEELLSVIFGYKEGVETHTLETHIYKLRQKIGDKEDGLILTCDGGYQINIE